MKWCRYSLLCIPLLLMMGCNQQRVVAGKPDELSLSRLGKSDINEVVEYHQHAVMRDLRQLMIKLYYRNPNQQHDKDKRSIEQSVARVFARSSAFGFEQWQGVKPTDIIRIALDQSYTGDRVLAFTIGLRRMLMAAYDDHTEFYYLTSIDPQKLYNSARNIEIAAWMIAEKTDLKGMPLLLSDSLPTEERNVSYQRSFGRMIATQDNMAEMLSFKNGRMLKTVLQSAASMAFLPI